MQRHGGGGGGGLTVPVIATEGGSAPECGALAEENANRNSEKRRLLNIVCLLDLLLTV